MIDTSISATNVTAGTNATATQYNALRADMAIGWVNPEITPTYSSVSGQVGVITVPSDATTLFEVGDKIRFKQGGGYKYFYVTAVTSTSLSITGGSEYTLTNAAITDFWASKATSPVDWPLASTIYLTVTEAATTNFDLNVSKMQIVTLTANRTFSVSNAKKGDAFVVAIKQGGSGSYTVTWWGSINWVDGSAPTLTTTVGKTDYVGFVYDGTNYAGGLVFANT